jgi:hypothetical protein
LHLGKSVSLTFGELRGFAPAVPRDVMQAAVIDLAQHDVVVIRR